MKSPRFERYENLKPPVHGGAEVSDDILDFSISVNPFPLPDSAESAYIDAWRNIGRYPDSECRSLVGPITDAFRLEPDEVLVTNGSAEAFSLIASVFLNPGDNVMIFTPCYSDYEHVSRLSGANVVEYSLCAETVFAPDIKKVSAEVLAVKPELVWLCNPNNPTGVIFDSDFVLAVADAADSYGGYLILDEAYTEFTESPGVEAGTCNSGTKCTGNIIRVRSLTKDFGVPGLRLGFISASAEIVRVLGLHKPCWSVNGPALETGRALLAELPYFRKSWKDIRILHRQLMDGMKQAGVDPYSASDNSCAAFVFFRPPGLTSRVFCRKMLENGIRVRDCATMGADGFCRIGVKQQPENDIFLAALKRVLREGA